MEGEPVSAGPGRVTISDVARAAGVSVATVSKAINGRYGVAPSTFSRVMSVVSELGYETSLVASSLRRRRTMVLGILVADFEPYSTELLKGASSAVHGSGYELLAYAGPVGEHRPIGWERRSLSRLAGTLIDGAIIVTPTVELTEGPIPVVAIDPHTGRRGPTTINADNLQAARTATEHLISLGHRRIAHLRGRSDLESARLREQGYRDALTEAGIPVDPSLVVDGDYRYDGGVQAAQELLRRPDRPTAVFAANDLSAIGVLDVARELGIRVPDELSVVGFDDIIEASRSEPALTTMAQPIKEMGALALRTLIQLLDGQQLSRHDLLPAQLVVRASTAPVGDTTGSRTET